MTNVASNEITARVPNPLPPRPRPRDPLAQTFTVPRDLVDADDGTDGVFLSKIVVYFEGRSNKHNLALEVREVENGYPTPKVLPFGRVVKKGSQVSVATVSENAWSGGTTFEFDSPIHILTETEYCFVIKPGGDSHDYKVWISRLGGTDKATGNPVTRDPGVGVLFLSTNDRTWVAHTDENVKFDLYVKKFETADAGETVELRNRPRVVLTDVVLGDGSMDIEGGMRVDLQGHTGRFGTVESWNKMEKELVVSQDTLAGPPSSAGNVEAYFESFGSKPASTDDDYDDRVANGTFGSASRRAKNIDVAWLEPRIYRGEYSNAKISGFAYRFGTGDHKGAVFNDRNHTLLNSFVSNTLDTGGSGTAREFEATMKMKSTNPYLSPTIDRQSASVVFYESLVDASGDISNEHLPGGGNAQAKYVGQTVELASDAEDIRVILTGFLPSGTEARVYARVLHSADDRGIRNQYWSRLERIGPVIHSSSQDRTDYIEIEYQIQKPVSRTNATFIGEASWVQASADVLTVANTVAAGDLILISKSASEYRVGVVESRTASAITLTRDLDLNTSNTDYDVSKIDDEYVHQAFRDAGAAIEGSAVYYDGNNRKYEGFRSFGVKIVLASDDPRKIPSIRDLRVIALDI